MPDKTLAAVHPLPGQRHGSGWRFVLMGGAESKENLGKDANTACPIQGESG